MRLERRGRVRAGCIIGTTWQQEDAVSAADKPFSIDKKLVYEAYKAVKGQCWCRRSGRSDDRTVRCRLEGKPLQALEQDEFGKLLSTAGTRRRRSEKRLAGNGCWECQPWPIEWPRMVVKQMIEPELDAVFLADSYGYRPGKSALDAVGVTRKRCWDYDWVLEFDIKGLFDNIDHTLPAARGSKAYEVFMGAVVQSKDG